MKALFGAGLRAAAQYMPRMRRRLRSRGLPDPPPRLPQVALDAGLVALAYYLAYRLRFDGGVPGVYMDLFERTIAFAIVGSVVVLRAVGLYRHWMRYASQRDYLKIAQACVVADARAGRPTSRSSSRG